jgi:hypothetical protein
MKIGICLFGIIYGKSGPYQDEKDIKHCWLNLKNMLIDPFKQNGHDVEIYLSTYQVDDSDKYEEILELVKPTKVIFSNFNNSNSITTKLAGLKDLCSNANLDIVILTRSDIHFSKKIVNENIDFNKFNFLFKEKGNWESRKFTTDNFYMFPFSMVKTVTEAFEKTVGSFYHTTHALYDKLISNINKNSINFISDIEELSDINSFYTVCRKRLDYNNPLINQEVKDKFYS